jgi:hypothetical protein
MGAIRSPKMSVQTYQTKLHDVTKVSEVHNRCFQDLKSDITHNVAENEFATT